MVDPLNATIMFINNTEVTITVGIIANVSGVVNYMIEASQGESGKTAFLLIHFFIYNVSFCTLILPLMLSTFSLTR